MSSAIEEENMELEEIFNNTPVKVWSLTEIDLYRAMNKPDTECNEYDEEWNEYRSGPILMFHINKDDLVKTGGYYDNEYDIDFKIDKFKTKYGFHLQPIKRDNIV